MFIKFKVLIYCSTFILVTLFTIRNNVIEATKGTPDGKTCFSTESISLNTTYDDDNQYFYDDSKKSKNIHRLQSILGDYISKGNKKAKEVNDELKLMFSNTEESISFKKQDVEIFATVMDEDTAVPVVPTFRTQSSSSSSQFDTKKFASSKNASASDEWKHDVMPDLNETEIHTFHDKDTVESDIKSEKSNITTDQTVNIPLSPDTFKPVNDSGTIADREDIPSFREWTEKHLAEEEKERGDDNNTNISSNGKRPKVRNKNYASLDCGAKLIATNPEAKSAGSLLSTNRDEYLLSPCNSKIWFVVELCEAIQLKKVELANFELFSSSPKDFSVLVSDRFPSREWTTVGRFLATDVKSVQSFNLQPHHFTKYIKVEFHSHYGKEHFCPLSIFKVYGTSEFEVLETVDEELENDGIENDDDVTEPIISDQDQKNKKKESSNNLFGSARDAVMNIVKKAAEALVITPSQTGSALSNETVISQNRTNFTTTRDCFTPRYSVLCKQCSEEFFNKVYSKLSCYLKELHEMLQINVIWKPLLKYHVCFSFGIAPIYVKANFLNFTRSNDFYALRLLPKEMLAALCNLIAISENKAKLNMTNGELLLPNQTQKKCDKAPVLDSVYQSEIPVSEVASPSSSSSTFKIVEYTTLTDDSYDEQKLSSQIKPTKTLTSDSEIPFILKDPAMATVIPNIAVIPEIPAEIESKTQESEDNEPIKEVDHSSVEIVEDSNSLDSLISELEKSEASQQSSSTSTQTSTPKPPLQKESVFVRLANRIKALERNMSLSGQYLEELSKRYKKQIEEAAEDRQKNLEREARRSQEINTLSQHVAELTVAVDALIAERDSWSYKFIMVGEHSLIIFIEIVIFIAIVCLCRGIPNVEISKRKFSLEWHRNRPSQDDTSSAGTSVKRRQSLDDLNINKTTKPQKRRPSEEALKIDGATHQDLLIYETNRSSRSENRRKRRKRKELLLKSNANAINLETGDNLMNRKPLLNKFSTAPLSRSASASEIDEHSWGRIDYSRTMHVDGKKPTTESYRQDENKYPPPFFKTATSVRNKRLSGQLNGVPSLSPVYDVSSDQDSSLPSTPVKEKKVNGIKKMVKRFF